LSASRSAEQPLQLRRVRLAGGRGHGYRRRRRRRGGGAAGRHHLARDAARGGRFVQQGVERRDVGIPFDQRRHRAETRQRGPVQIPDGRRDAGAVMVD
jgi:hypothetical protein